MVLEVYFNKITFEQISRIEEQEELRNEIITIRR